MSRNTRKRASASSTKLIIKKEKVAEPLSENIFASPWKHSDTILVVSETEFHVHRTILTMHSPVFEAMFGGSFKEANLDKVDLPGKTPEEMLQFLKLLYPESMIRTPTINFGKGEKIVYSVLRIADEYQTEELIRKCLAKICILTSNVFQILPYASKYNFKVREKCVSHVAKYVPMDHLEKAYIKLEPPLMQELLVAKCRHLEACLAKKNSSTVKTIIAMAGSTDESDDSSLSESSD